MNWLANLFRTLSPNCRDAVRRQSEALDRPLTGLSRWGLWIHLLLCRACRRYGRQLRFLRSSSRHCSHPEASLPGPDLSAAARERLKKALRK